MKKIILAIAIAITFALTIISVLPNKIYASEISDIYGDLVYSKNLFDERQIIDHYDNIDTYYYNAPDNVGDFQYSGFQLVLFNDSNYSGVVVNEYLSYVNITYGLNYIYFNIENDGIYYLRVGIGGSLQNDDSYCGAVKLKSGNYVFSAFFKNATPIALSFKEPMLNYGSIALEYEPYLTGSMIYNDAYNQALIDSMYWLNEYNTTLVDIVELNNNKSYKDINAYAGSLNIAYTTGLYGKADFKQLVSDFAYELANYENIYEQWIEIELQFETPIIFNDKTSTNFTTNDIEGFTFYSVSGNEYHYDFSGSSEGAKDYVHNIVEGQNIYNVPFEKMKIRLIQTRYSTIPSPVISFIPDFYNEGYSQGYDEGNANGYNSGFNGGYDKGYDDGYNTGFQGGFNEGVNNGDLKSTGLQQMFLTILGFPITALQGIFNFEIFGINLLSLITFILTIGIVVFVIKKFI